MELIISTTLFFVFLIYFDSNTPGYMNIMYCLVC